MLRKPIKTIEQENGSIAIYGNNQPRNLLSWKDLTATEQGEFISRMENPKEQSYIRYKGHVICLGDFMHIGSNAPFYGYGYNGYSPDSFFSGLLIKLVNEDQVKVYTYIS